MTYNKNSQLDSPKNTYPYPNFSEESYPSQFFITKYIQKSQQNRKLDSPRNTYPYPNFSEESYRSQFFITKYIQKSQHNRKLDSPMNTNPYPNFSEESYLSHSSLPNTFKNANRIESIPYPTSQKSLHVSGSIHEWLHRPRPRAKQAIQLPLVHLHGVWVYC